MFTLSVLLLGIDNVLASENLPACDFSCTTVTGRQAQHIRRNVNSGKTYTRNREIKMIFLVCPYVCLINGDSCITARISLYTK